MWTLFKKDLKHYKNNAGKISKLFSVLQLLEPADFLCTKPVTVTYNKA